MLAECKNWRLALQLGEKLTPQLRAAFRKLNLPGLRLANAYGPAEATISCARGAVPLETDGDVNSQNDSLWAMPNYSLTVVDTQMRILPVGFPGEICISGSGVALGYLNRPEETVDRFVELDTSKVTAGKLPSINAYRTGDRGRLMDDGSLQVFGRLTGDGQVKIRGYRVELDEIAGVLLQTAGGVVANAAVSYRVEEDLELLVAFIVLDAKFAGDKAELIHNLRTNLPLPSHMCPSMFVQSEHIPVNVNGKKDQKAVDKLPISRVKTLGASPAQDDSRQLSALELKVKDVWEEVLPERTILGLELIHRSSDFFRVGGNSLLAIRLRSRIRACFGVDLPLPQIFQHSTLGSMAGLVLMGSSDVQTRAQSPIPMDWNAELVALSSGFSTTSLANSAKPNGSKEGYNALIHRKPEHGFVVLLTGATGFLGTKVLRLLAADPQVQAVHCVAIRPGQDGQRRHVAVSTPKVVEYMGDLADEHLGLSHADFQYLAKTVDVILHNGAAVKSYDTLRGPNVHSTSYLCELALPRRIPICFVSSAAVAAVRHGNEAASGTTGYIQPLPAVSLAHYMPPSDADHFENVGGYALSKWASEGVLERVAMEHGVPICVYRPATIIGDGGPSHDLMSAVLDFSRKLGTAPVTDGLDILGSFDLVDGDDVARDLVGVTLSMPGGFDGARCMDSQEMLQFRHYSNPSRIPLTELDVYLQKTDGRFFAKMPLADWLNSALESGFDKVLYGLLKEVAGGQRHMLLPAIC